MGLAGRFLPHAQEKEAETCLKHDSPSSSGGCEPQPPQLQHKPRAPRGTGQRGVGSCWIYGICFGIWLCLAVPRVPGGALSHPAPAAASPPQGEAQPARVRAPGACLHMKVAVRSAGLYHLLYDLIWRVPQPPFPTLCMLGCQGPGLSLSALPGLSRQAVIP